MRLNSIALMASALIAGSVQAQNWPGLAVRRVANGVEVLDSAVALPRRIYFDSTQRWVDDISVAPGGRRIGMVRFTRLEPDSGTYAEKRTSEVIVLDAVSGRPQLSVSGGLFYFWCGADCIAVLYGRYSEGFEGSPSGDSLDVFRPSAGARSQSYKAPSGGFVDPHWFYPDSSIISGGWSGAGREFRRTFLRLDLKTGRVASVEPLVGDISGSGRFAIQRDYGEPAHVSRAGISVLPSIEGRWQVEEWLGRTDQVLLLLIPPRRPPPPGTPNGVRPRPPRDPNAPPAERTYRIWDVGTGQVSEEWKAAETAWRGPAPNGCRLFLKDGNLTAAPGCQ